MFIVRVRICPWYFGEKNTLLGKIPTCPEPEFFFLWRRRTPTGQTILVGKDEKATGQPSNLHPPPSGRCWTEGDSLILYLKFSKKIISTNVGDKNFDHFLMLKI
jgi:hypothetical protein